MRVNSNSMYNSLNWPYLYDADAFYQFRVLIRILNLISIPNHSRDSFSLIKLNTLHSWKEFVIVNSNSWYNSHNWSYLYDADACFLISCYDSDSRRHFHSKSFQRFIHLNIIEYFTHMERICESQFILVVIFT